MTTYDDYLNTKALLAIGVFLLVYIAIATTWIGAKIVQYLGMDVPRRY